jgi:hypothetical protein
MAMRALTVTAMVRADHTLTVQVPADIPPGMHQVVVVLQEEAPSSRREPLFANWPPPHNVGPADPACTYRRENMYGDDGR